jgi:hypothetical protein
MTLSKSADGFDMKGPPLTRLHTALALKFYMIMRNPRSVPLYSKRVRWIALLLQEKRLK